MGARNYRDLVVWQKAMDLATAVYQASRELPKDETYGLVGQMRRAAVSVPSNIAEGEGRWSSAEFAHFVGIANGSLRELETQLLLCQRLGYLHPDKTAGLLHETTEISRLLGALSRSLKP